MNLHHCSDGLVLGLPKLQRIIVGPVGGKGAELGYWAGFGHDSALWLLVVQLCEYFLFLCLDKLFFSLIYEPWVDGIEIVWLVESLLVKLCRCLIRVIPSFLFLFHVKRILLTSDSKGTLLLCRHFFYVTKLLFYAFGENGFILAQLVQVEIVIIEVRGVGTWVLFVQNVLGIYAPDPGMKQNFFQPGQWPQTEFILFL